MTQSTPKLGLLLYDVGAPDNQATFLQFRTDLAGVSTSNFLKIDTAVAGIDTRLTAVEGLKPIVKLEGISTDNTNYTATNANITSLYNGLIVDFIPNQDNAGTATLTINGGDSKTINKVNSSGVIVNLEVRDLIAYHRYLIEYDGTQWILVNATSADQVNVNGTPGTILIVGTDNSITASSIPVVDNKITADSLLRDPTALISESGTLALSKPLSASTINKGIEWGTDGRAINVADNKIEPTEIDIDASLRDNAGALGLNLSGITAGTYKGTTYDATGRATASAGKVQATEINHSARLAETSGILDLTTTGITAGTYKGLTLDVYGRVTATNNLIAGNEININSSLSSTGGVLGVALAPDSSKLGGKLPSYYAVATHNHDHGALTGLADDDHTQYAKHPESSTDNAIVRWDGTGGRTLQNSSVAIDDNGKLSGDGLDGWIYDTDTWTYVSATSFKITGKDVRYRFPNGTKIKLVQSSTTKYFYVVATSYTHRDGTIVTVTGGSDYALANENISGQAYSYAAAPQNFPQWLNYTPVWSADGGTPVLGNGTLFGKFSMIGANIHYLGNLQLGSTTSVGTTTNWKFSLPISLVDDYRYLGQAFIRDLGVATYMRTINLEKNTDADNIILFLQMDSGTNKNRISYNDPFEFGNGDIIAWDIWYAI